MFDVPKRAVAGEGDRDGRASWSGHAFDVPAEEVEPVIDVGARAVFSGESVNRICSAHELGRLLLDRLGLSAGAGHHHQESHPHSG